MQSPSFKQWLKLPSVLNKNEARVLIISTAIFILSFIWFNNLFLNNNTIEVPEHGGTHIEGIVGQPSSINPIYAPNSDAERMITELVFSGLYKYNSSGEIITDLAVNMPEIKGNGTIYEIYLRDDAVWHDNTPVTADDIIFTVKTLQDPEYKSPLRANWIGTSIEKIGEYGVRFRLKNPYPDFLERLTFKIIPKHIWGDITAAQFPFSPYNFKPIGSGPYALTDVLENIKQDSKGRFISIKFTAFNKYYAGISNLHNVIFNFYDSEDSLIKAAKSGKITGFVNRNNISINGFDKNKFLMPRYFALFFNTDGNNEALQDIKVRQALNYSTNKEEILNNVLKGEGIIVDSPILPDIYGFAEPEKIYTFDQEKAKELLSSAGYVQQSGVWAEPSNSASGFTKDLVKGSTGAEVTLLQECLISLNTESEKIYPEEKITGTFGPATEKAVNRFQEKYKSEILDPQKLSKPTGDVKAGTRTVLNRVCKQEDEGGKKLIISISTIDDPTLSEVAKLVQKQWKSIGVTTEIKIFSLSDLKQIALMPRSYDVMLFGEVLGTMPDPFPFWHSSQSDDPGLNLSLYANKKVDKLLEQARQDSNVETRIEKLVEAQNLIIEDAPAVFLYNPYNNYMSAKHIKGIEEGRITDIPKIFSDFTNWHIKTKRIWK